MQKRRLLLQSFLFTRRLNGCCVLFILTQTNVIILPIFSCYCVAVVIDHQFMIVYFQKLIDDYHQLLVLSSFYHLLTICSPDVFTLDRRNDLLFLFIDTGKKRMPSVISILIKEENIVCSLSWENSWKEKEVNEEKMMLSS